MPVLERSPARPAKPDRSGRDEMNLVEFPIALLSQRINNGILSFQKERTLTLPDGGELKQKWVVTGAPEYGLPQPTDEDVLLGLLKISADDGFSSSTVHFTQRGLLNVLRWSCQGWHFKRLEQALARLKTTSIRATNAFWNNAAKAYQTRHFGIIDAYELYERRDSSVNTFEVARSSNWARFSNEFFSSIQAGYIKPLDLTLYFSLRRTLSKRLFRYIDKKRFQKKRFEIGLQQLASVHLGLSDSTCQYASWIKKELDRAHQELVDCGYLASVAYERNRNDDWKVVYVFAEPRAMPEQLSLPASPPSPPEEAADGDLIPLLMERGMSRTTAQELVSAKPAGLIRSQVEGFDRQRRRKDARPIQNPAGFLAKAIREEWSMESPEVPPSEGQVRVQKHVAAVQSERAQEDAAEVERQARIARWRAALPAEELERLRADAAVQVRTKLGITYGVRDESPLFQAVLGGLIYDHCAAAEAGS